MIPVGPVAPSIKRFFFDFVADIMMIEAGLRQIGKEKLSMDGDNEH
jgi:hypothetical protein